MNTTAVVNRRELEFSVSGIMHPQYTREDTLHVVERLHTKGALRLLDLDITGTEEIIEGVRCELAGAHTEGSMNIIVETAQGAACICGDTIYDLKNQVVDEDSQPQELEPRVTGNHANSIRSEKGAIKKLLHRFSIVLPSHTPPARVENGRVVGLLSNTIPGDIHESIRQPKWSAG